MDNIEKNNHLNEKFNEVENIINKCHNNLPSELAWKKISKEILTKELPFEFHHKVFLKLFPNWPRDLISGPVCMPDESIIRDTNLSLLMKELKIETLPALRSWINQNREKFWEKIINILEINFSQNYESICDLSNGIESPHWLVSAKMNIVDSCFLAPAENTALIFYDEKDKIQKISFFELQRYVNRIANGLINVGFKSGDALAIIMPMTVEAIALYLGIIKIGGVVVSIADSFSAEEIATRLRISKATGVFTQNSIIRNNKPIPLYEKIIAANPRRIVVLNNRSENKINLRQEDLCWENFISDKEDFDSIACDPMSACNILFSSGTTGDPKAIPWNHTTAIKAGSDAFLHQNIKENDVLAWPTNLGWMMGPWLIFAAFINKSAIALYPDVARGTHFGKFIQDAKVTMLGVVPTLVSTWRQSRCMENLDWSSIKIFSSTGECSNAEDMFYLSYLANYKPIIEYCGGTEIGGAYITSTVIENNYPSVFTTPALGLDLLLLDENGNPSDEGEVALIPPSIGLSTTLLNADHHEIYYAKMPSAHEKILRRHGDQARRLDNGFYTLLGRADDTMNLGGIKISSTEIERVLSGINNISEVAAVAVASQGPSQLIIFAATPIELDKLEILKLMQSRINTFLNPLFKISDVVFLKELPKTASNKIMRRLLRKNYKS